MKSSSSFYWATDAQRESFCRDGDVGLSLQDSDEEDEETGSEMAEWRPLVEQQVSYGTHRERAKKKTIRFQDESIRFQVVIWYVGPVNVQIGQVPMRFRITLFWNDKRTRNNGEDGKSTAWTMEGRQMACLQIVDDNKRRIDTVDVPPVSILNAVSFELEGSPEVSMLDEDSRLMRWTCMYSAILSQTDHLDVRNFPHDKHDLMLKIGILAHRSSGSRWDRNLYQLGLATKEDSQGSTSIPHGLVLDHVAVPDFSRDDLKFEFVPLTFGHERLIRYPSEIRGKRKIRDTFLRVSLPVCRQSGHYDKSIMPILAMLNIVAITCLPRNFDSATASTETILSIAFVQVGIRLTIDSRLPSVGYQIKMQRILNMSFWLLCFLVLESNVAFFLVTKMGWEITTTDWIDLVSACISFMFTFHILLSYYWDEAYFDLSRLKHVVSGTVHSEDYPAEHK